MSPLFPEAVQLRMTERSKATERLEMHLGALTTFLALNRRRRRLLIFLAFLFGFLGVGLFPRKLGIAIIPRIGIARVLVFVRVGVAPLLIIPLS